jgi:hypothetical protein
MRYRSFFKGNLVPGASSEETATGQGARTAYAAYYPLGIRYGLRDFHVFPLAHSPGAFPAARGVLCPKDAGMPERVTAHLPIRFVLRLSQVLLLNPRAARALASRGQSPWHRRSAGNRGSW